MTHRSGFINIIGRPNVGKSTLMNALVGERMSIITNKPQTTRHRIIGILSGDDFQLVFSDTPGLIRKPNYKMQEAMNKFVHGSFEDADVFLFVTDPIEKYADDDDLVGKLKKTDTPVFVCLNKIDTIDQKRLEEWSAEWQARIPNAKVYPISALSKFGTEELLKKLVAILPEGPSYYPKDQLTDKPERFFVAEIIREKILLLYREEIPYSCEVVVQSFKEGTTKSGDAIIRIEAHIYVSRDTQKSIIIGKGGEAIKKLGMMSRKSLVEWLASKIHLELFVKVKKDWRNDERALKRFGY